jgi:MoaA/NifB/PqqE/SkfB family radical SAM enzyme
MAIDLIAAAKRRRNGDYSVASNGVYQHELDTNALADAYTLELDDTPVTVEALDAMFGPRSIKRGWWDIVENVQITIESSGYVIKCSFWPVARGKIRRLGIEVKHEG